MYAEFEIAWAALKNGGILLADNIVDNTAFFDFCAKVDRHPLVFAESNPDSPARTLP